MLELNMHLTEDELLALRDRRDDDSRRLEHLRTCKLCKKRFAFLSAFKSAFRVMKKDFFEPYREEELPTLMSQSQPEVSFHTEEFRVYESKPPESHPGTDTLLAYFEGAIQGRERDRIQEHILGCERCKADILVLARSKPAAAKEEVHAAREHFREHGTRVAYPADSPQVVEPQLLLAMEDDPGEKVRFRVLGRPDASGRMGPGRPHPDERIEVMVGTARVTITAHRKGKKRFIDVLVRELGSRISRAAAKISMERKGEAIAALLTDKGGKASVAVPDDAPFDLRIDGGWTLPVFLHFNF